MGEALYWKNAWRNYETRQLESKIREQESKIEELRKQRIAVSESISFLRLKFDSDAGRGISEGDITIIVENQTEEPLHANKFVLSSESPVFCKMFETELLEKKQGVVHIEDATLDVMRAVVKFCYDAQVNFSDQVPAEEVFEMENKYDIRFLRKICEEHLSATIDHRNLAKRLKLANTHQATDLQAAASECFKVNFDSVLSHVVGGL